MTRADAVAECERLAREHADRDTATWFPRQDDSGDWVVIRVPRPAGALKRDELRPGLADSVRPDPSQDVPREPFRYT